MTRSRWRGSTGSYRKGLSCMWDDVKGRPEGPGDLESCRKGGDWRGGMLGAEAPGCQRFNFGETY